MAGKEQMQLAKVGGNERGSFVNRWIAPSLIQLHEGKGRRGEKENRNGRR